MEHAVYNATQQRKPIEQPRGLGPHWKYFHPIRPAQVKVRNYSGRGSDIRRLLWAVIFFGLVISIELAYVLLWLYR